MAKKAVIFAVCHLWAWENFIDKFYRSVMKNYKIESKFTKRNSDHVKYFLIVIMHLKTAIYSKRKQSLYSQL